MLKPPRNGELILLDMCVELNYLKSLETGETITLMFSSPVEPGGPKAMTGSFTFLFRLLPEFRGRGSSDLSCSARSAARYTNVWSATHMAGYMNSVDIHKKFQHLHRSLLEVFNGSCKKFRGWVGAGYVKR